MKPIHRLLNFLFIGILLLACEDEQQAWLSEMEGTPDCSVPTIIGIGLPVTITASGITTPSNVAYTWDAPEFSPSTFTGTTFETTAPITAGEYNIFITAHSAGYHDVTIKKKITVVKCTPMQGHLSISVPSIVVANDSVQFMAMGITLPTEENVTYQWTAPNGFTSSSYTGGAIFKTKAREQIGTYTISVRAMAKNYCDTISEATVPVVEGRKMQGMFGIDVSPAAMVGEQVTFAARGIIEPSTGITYTWNTHLFTAGTASGNSYTATCPDNSGTHTIEVRLSATGYSDSTIKADVIVYPKHNTVGGISITVLPDEVITSQTVTFHVTNSITTPTEGISYKWDAPGFSPNLYQSTGNTFTATAPVTTGPRTVTVTATIPRYSSTTATAAITVKGGKDMTSTGGTLDFNEPPQIVKDLPATFSINSTLTAGASSITYEWLAPGFDPATFSGPTFTGTPTIAGQRTITLHAIAEGYTTVIKSKPVNVIEGLPMGELTISANDSPPFNAGIKTVTFAPALTGSLISPVTYTWEATNCEPGSHTGNQYNPTLPKEAGKYEIKLTAQATGYLPKIVTYPYTITCRPMTVGFTISPRTELLTKDEITLSVVPPSAPTSGLSYTWTIPAGFKIKEGTGSSTTPSVTIIAPDSELANPATLTLTAEAVNYCPATHTATVTVKECYDLPANERPVISASLNAPFEDGMFQVSNLQNVTFKTDPITPLRNEGAVTYKWWFDPNSGGSFTPSSYSSAITTTFETKAPVRNNNATFTLNLQVAAEGYCPVISASEKVVVVGSAGQLQGTVEILEVVAPTNPAGPPEMWMVQDRPATLTAQYNGPEPKEQINLRYKWFWEDGPDSDFLEENDGRLYYTPNKSIANGKVRVEVHDNNGKDFVYKEYPLSVNNCAASNLPGLYVDVNHQCGLTGNAISYAYVMGETKGSAYRVHALSTESLNKDKWWFTENLRANKMGDARYHEVYGAYYPESAVAELANSSNDKYCPKGWRIPSSDEWGKLNTGISSEPIEQFEALASSEEKSNPVPGDIEWDSNKVTNIPRAGQNYRGFNLVPASAYNGTVENPRFLTPGATARFWTSTGSIQVYGNLSSDDPAKGKATSESHASGYFYTVRCINDYVENYD
jgi:uncharacterized protein (TIGR02145 family)